MASVSENLNIIASVKGEIREMLGASDHLQSYPNAIASAMTDEPIDGEWLGVRPVADGASIKDGVAFLARIKGKTVGGVNSKPEAIVSKQRMKTVDLGTLPWTTTGTGSTLVFAATVSGMKGSGNLNEPANIYCPIYKTIASNTDIVQANDKAIALTSSGTGLRVRDSAYTKVADFKAAMSGVMLTYESLEEETLGRLDIVLPSIFADGLASAGDIYDEIDYLHNVAIKRVGVAEPIIEPIDAKAWYKVASGGSEEAVCGNGVPLVAEIAYRKDYTETINDYELAKTLI